LPMMPTFSQACVYDPTFLRLYAKSLAKFGVTLPTTGGSYQRYTGDTSALGKGEILIWQPTTITG
jgi:hypothetical protein